MPAVYSSQELPEQIDRYKVVRLLGYGAMGRVLLAHDPVLDRDVAIKHLREDLSVLPDQKATLVGRMKQEARASARVSHPGIVALHDMGEDRVLGWYLVFEYVEGDTLKKRLERGPLTAGKVADMARTLGSALTTAHRSGVVHRDIKPENLMLAATGVKIADFGIARVPDSTLTVGGRLLGTPAYSAPEAIGNGRFSSRSDQFSLAATLYEALSGRRAFPGDDAVSVATKISMEEPPPIAAVCNVDLHTDTVFARALSKNASSRYDTCEDFGNALAEALTMSTRASQHTLPDAVHRRQQARRGLALTLTTAALAFAAGATVPGLLGLNLRPDSAHTTLRPQPLEQAPVAWLPTKKGARKSDAPSSNAPSSSDGKGRAPAQPARTPAASDPAQAPAPSEPAQEAVSPPTHAAEPVPAAAPTGAPEERLEP